MYLSKVIIIPISGLKLTPRQVVVQNEMLLFNHTVFMSFFGRLFAHPHTLLTKKYYLDQEFNLHNLTV